jgi:amidase
MSTSHVPSAELAFAAATEQADLVRRKEISPVELVEIYLDRIEAINPVINAYVTVAGEQARASARQAEATIAEGGDLPPFLGVPISIKDMAATAGIRTTRGCAAWSDRVPDTDDEVVARIRRAGFIILGKTVVPELGAINVCEPPGYPPGRNPWDPERSCGGSSGGAAAAVVAGLCPISQGSDGGGSIRNPSAWCGAFGLKPSRGRISDAPRSQQFFGVNGPISRSVGDAAALLDVMAGPTVGDAFWAPPPPLAFGAGWTRSPGRMRIAFNARTADPDLPVDEAWMDAVADAAQVLEGLGHVVEEVDLPTFAGGDSSMMTDLALIFAGAWAARDDVPAEETLTVWTRSLIERGRQVSASQVMAAQERVIRACRHVVQFFERYDLLLTPTVAQPPPMVGEFADLTYDGVMRLWAYTPFTGLWNTTGQPAVSIPWTIDHRGLPVAIQLVGRPTDELTLLQVSGQIEAAHPWSGLRPPAAELRI